jgi:hypothetical protein
VVAPSAVSDATVVSIESPVSGPVQGDDSSGPHDEAPLVAMDSPRLQKRRILLISWIVLICIRLVSAWVLVASSRTF